MFSTALKKDIDSDAKGQPGRSPPAEGEGEEEGISRPIKLALAALGVILLFGLVGAAIGLMARQYKANVEKQEQLQRRYDPMPSHQDGDDLGTIVAPTLVTEDLLPAGEDAAGGDAGAKSSPQQGSSAASAKADRPREKIIKKAVKDLKDAKTELHKEVKDLKDAKTKEVKEAQKEANKSKQDAGTAKKGADKGKK